MKKLYSNLKSEIPTLPSRRRALRTGGSGVSARRPRTRGQTAFAGSGFANSVASASIANCLIPAPVTDFERQSRALTEVLMDRDLVSFDSQWMSWALGTRFYSGAAEALAAWVHSYLTSGRLDPGTDVVDQLEDALLSLPCPSR